MMYKALPSEGFVFFTVSSPPLRVADGFLYPFYITI